MVRIRRTGQRQHQHRPNGDGPGLAPGNKEAAEASQSQQQRSLTWRTWPSWPFPAAGPAPPFLCLLLPSLQIHLLRARVWTNECTGTLLTTHHARPVPNKKACPRRLCAECFLCRNYNFHCLWISQLHCLPILPWQKVSIAARPIEPSRPVLTLHPPNALCTRQAPEIPSLVTLPNSEALL